MNQIAWQIYGGSKAKANTFIGGVASTITTAGALATKLAIASNRITNFKIVGSNIECRISGSYVIPGLCFYQNLDITYYTDIDGLVTDMGDGAFRATRKITELNFKGIITLNGSYTDRDSQIQTLYLKNCTSVLGFLYNDYYPANKIFYIPLVTALGANSVNNEIFYNSLSSAGSKIYANPSLQTSNAGGVEGDLAYAISKGAIVRYVTNFTAPNSITNLSVGNVYGTAVQLNFTAPIGSTNAIDYYEVWQNGINTGKRITASGEYVVGLTLNTAYTFQLIPVDIFFNKSTSNTIATSTLVNYYVPTGDLVSYYKMENNVLDSWGSNNGIATAITYASGLVGQTAVFNGSTSIITVPDNDTLTFANATNDLPFSIGYSIKTSDNQFFILSKNSSNASVREYEIYYDNGQLGFRLSSNGNVANRLTQVCIISMTGTWINVIHTYNGLGNGGMKTYINGVLAISTNTMLGTYLKMANSTNPLSIGKQNTASGYELNGQLDEVSIWNAELTALQITEINAKLNTGQSLI